MGTVQHFPPMWVTWVQSGSTLAVAIAATGGALYFGWWQQRIAREKLALDLFEKRLVWFDRVTVLHDTLRELFMDRELNIEGPLEPFIQRWNEASFLFDRKTAFTLMWHSENITRALRVRDTDKGNSRISDMIMKAIAEISRIKSIWGNMMGLSDLRNTSFLRSVRAKVLTLLKSRFRRVEK